MERFTFNSNEVKFINDPDFIQSLFSGKLVNK
ncbi:hypothetical protein ABID52_000626 [Fictibacillus halophilus]|uniref:Uncharacterized protein n=1 Tax=Fictibacillus halophilus TaxID=1610490 RepID=A0ABV2LEM3_9BACL